MFRQRVPELTFVCRGRPGGDISVATIVRANPLLRPQHPLDDERPPQLRPSVGQIDALVRRVKE
jgi:hypothetical protein